MGTRKNPPSSSRARADAARRVFKDTPGLERALTQRLAADVSWQPDLHVPPAASLRFPARGGAQGATAAQVEALVQRVCVRAAPRAERSEGDRVGHRDALAVSALVFVDGAPSIQGILSHAVVDAQGPLRELLPRLVVAGAQVQRAVTLELPLSALEPGAGAALVMAAVFVHSAAVETPMAADHPSVLGLVGADSLAGVRAWAQHAVDLRNAVQVHQDWVQRAWRALVDQMPVVVPADVLLNTAARQWERDRGAVMAVFGVGAQDADRLRAQHTGAPQVQADVRVSLQQQALVGAYGRQLKVPVISPWLDVLARELTVDMPAGMDGASHLRAHMQQSRDSEALWWAACVQREVLGVACPTVASPVA
jgi:hypothetical protein